MEDSEDSERSPKPKTGERWYETYLKGVGEGERNEAASKLAGRYFSMGMTLREVDLLLGAWNRSNNPPMPKSELVNVIESIQERENQSEICEVDNLMESISSILRVNLSSVKRVTGDEPQFVLEFDAGACTLTTGQLLSPKSFQQSIAEATKIVVRKLSTKTSPTHEGLVQMIMNCAEDVDAGMEATGVGELIILLKDYLGSQQIIPILNKEEGAPRHGVFQDDSLIWVSLTDLVQRSGARWGMRTSIKQMAQRLRANGIRRETFRMEDGGFRIMWGVDPLKIGIDLEDK